MSGLKISYGPDLLVGSNEKDDAGVFRVNENLALVQTVDFITPVCDDPYEFGRVAACNSLSDVYAMGGTPVTAMNIMCFPDKKFSLDIMQKILDGGLSVINEAGVQLVGGHSVSDNELKYGLSVTGYVHPDKILRNNAIKPGDCLVLTKPLGTGIIATAIKAELAEDIHVTEFIKSMTTLNRYAAEAISDFPVNACTDITGFGLAGHLLEMMEGNNYSVTINSFMLPVLPGVDYYASIGLVPAGLYRNRDYVGDRCTFAENIIQIVRDMMFDPQTSGGLLVSIPEKHCAGLLEVFKNKGINASVIGEIRASTDKRIFVI